MNRIQINEYKKGAAAWHLRSQFKNLRDRIWNNRSEIDSSSNGITPRWTLFLFWMEKNYGAKLDSEPIPDSYRENVYLVFPNPGKLAEFCLKEI